MLLAYIIGNYLDYYAIPIFTIALTVIYTILIPFLPEAPIFLVRQNKIEVSTKNAMDRAFIQLDFKIFLFLASKKVDFVL